MLYSMHAIHMKTDYLHFCTDSPYSVISILITLWYFEAGPSSLVQQDASTAAAAVIGNSSQSQRESMGSASHRQQQQQHVIHGSTLSSDDRIDDGWWLPFSEYRLEDYYSEQARIDNESERPWPNISEHCGGGGGDIDDNPVTADLPAVFRTTTATGHHHLVSSWDDSICPEASNPFYYDYDWVRWSEPRYNVPSLDMNWLDTKIIFRRDFFRLCTNDRMINYTYCRYHKNVFMTNFYRMEHNSECP